MKNCHRLVALVVAFYLLQPTGAAFALRVSAPVISPINSHAYYLLSSSTWFEAEQEAQRLGGHLATIRNEAENDWVWKTFGSVGHLWIGLNDIDREGRFVWLSGERESFRAWAPGEPNDSFGAEDRVFMWNDSGTWNDYVDLSAIDFVPIYGVAEVVTPIPEPSSAVLALVAAVAIRRWRQR